jgi:AAA+ superfamily predicted ATPase
MNRAYMAASIDQIRTMLRKHVKGTEESAPVPGKKTKLPTWSSGPPPAIESIRTLFGLSQFEKFLLLLCAAVELDSETARVCAKAQGDLGSVYPTFGLALGALPQPHWSALTPSSALRRFRLIDVLSSPSSTLTTSPLRIEERVLHYLTGVPSPEPALNGIVKPVVLGTFLTGSHQEIADRIVDFWRSAPGRMPQVQMWGSDEGSKLAVSKAACSKMGLALWHLPSDAVPPKTDEVERLAQLWAREAALLGSGLFISAEEAEPQAQRAVRRMADSIPGPVILGTREPWPSSDTSTVLIQVTKPSKAEQAGLWRTFLEEAKTLAVDTAETSRLVGQFDLNAQTIRSAVGEANLRVRGGAGAFDSLWDACRIVTRPRIGDLAQQIVPKATMEDLVLPEKEKRLLGELAQQVLQRRKVYEDWGFEGKMSRGLGIAALFAGPSGTGKTMAAEALASELRLDLFGIDLANVVSKYIGETEKNLRRVFDAAEDGGAILFFDEADALFGRRSEVKDSHDRYANIEVGYLLQRMESYTGLAILATNMKSSLDPAFVRRIRFIVDFPFPDQMGRAEIWRRVFPSSTPTEGLEIEELAKMSIAGGNIRNIALYASFLAAGEEVPVTMKHLRRAAEVEYTKLERPLTHAESGAR